MPIPAGISKAQGFGEGAEDGNFSLFPWCMSNPRIKEKQLYLFLIRSAVKK